MSEPARTTDISCRLGALLPEERTRRQELAASIQRATIRVEETDGGYLLHLPDDEAVQSSAFELILLERRCCPFLTLELGFSDDNETRLYIGGGPGVKEFLADTDVLGCAGISERECNCS